MGEISIKLTFVFHLVLSANNKALDILGSFPNHQLTDNILYLKIAFEISNSHQKEIVEKFLNCLDKQLCQLIF